MADIGLNPPLVRVKDAFTGTMTDATGKYGMVVKGSGTANFADVTVTTDAGDQPRGVIASQGDPNNSGLFASGDNVTVQTDGYAEVLMDAGSVLVAGVTKIIASGNNGQAKILEAESDPYWLLGVAAQSITIGAAAGLASVKLAIQWIAAD